MPGITQRRRVVAEVEDLRARYRHQSSGLFWPALTSRRACRRAGRPSRVRRDAARRSAPATRSAGRSARTGSAAASRPALYCALVIGAISVPAVGDDRQLALVVERACSQAQARMETVRFAAARGALNFSSLRLRQRDVRRRRPHRRVLRVVRVRHDHVVAVVAAEQEHADQRLVVRSALRLGGLDAVAPECAGDRRRR